MTPTRALARRSPRRVVAHLVPALVYFAPAAASAQLSTVAPNPAPPPSATAAVTAALPPASIGSAASPHVVESGLSLVAGLSLFFHEPAASTELTASVPRSVRWRGGVLMDEPVRDAMRLRSDDARERAAMVSDMLLGALVLDALAVDGVAVPLAQGDPDFALEASSAYALALGTTLMLGEIVKAAVSRARPFERYCLEDASNPGCGNDDSISSFYSLHSAVAFTSAGFSCVMHVGRNLFGDEAADIGACGASLAAATTVALLRVAADRHYLTDVIVGSLIGLAVGLVVPLLLVPRRTPPGIDREPAAPQPVLMPLFAPGANGDFSTSTVGLSFAGMF